MGHFPVNGTANPSVDPPIPTEAQNYLGGDIRDASNYRCQ